MKIRDMSGTVFDVANSSDVERILLKRYDRGVNAFWLHHEPRQVPSLLILVNNQLAKLDYFPDEKDHPGYHSIGRVPSPPADGTTVFFMNNPKEEEHVYNGAIVPFRDALAAAKEFLVSAALPPSIEWFEL
jgi:hypothetical protein